MTDWITLITVVGATVAMLIKTFYAEKRAAVEFQRIWDAQLRANQTEAVAAEMATQDSPFVPSAEAMTAFRDAGFVEKLRVFYELHGRGKPDAEVLKLLEGEFGDSLMNDISLRRGWTHGAVMALAVGLAKGLDLAKGTIDMGGTTP
jgi:hypothetical protein